MSVDTTSAESANWGSLTSVAGSVAPSMGEDPIDPKDATVDPDSEVPKLADSEDDGGEIGWDADCVVVGRLPDNSTFAFTPPSTFHSEDHARQVDKVRQIFCSKHSAAPADIDSSIDGPTKDEAPTVVTVGSTGAKSWLCSWWS